MKSFDYLVVGSGCSGAMAAQTLVEAGLNVTMIDVGATNKNYDGLVPDKDFISIRKTEKEQYKYFIGKNAEGVVWGDIGKGAQVTPPRSHIAKFVDKYMAIKSNSFSPLESLGYGGLGIGWGLQCWEYSEEELDMAGLDVQKTIEAYNVVSERIGISATKDSASSYTLGKLKSFLPSPKMDRNHELIYKKYQKKLLYFKKRGIHIGRTPLALLTKNLGKRKKYGYKDMDFYTDRDMSGWRPWMTVNDLRTKNNFTYIAGYLVLSFQEKNNYTDVTCLDINTDKKTTFRCQTLVLATNPISSARIVLRSAKKFNTRVPILCNPYTYVPCIQPRMIGKEVEKKKLGFAQLTLFLDEKKNNYDMSVASLYSYQSLMLFRIIRQIPLNFRDARTIMRYLMSGLVIMGIHHPDKQSKNKYLELVSDKKSITGDRLNASYKLTYADTNEYKRRENKSIKSARKLGLFAIARINPGFGSSVHYAGTLPFDNTDRQLSLSSRGKLNATRAVYVADSSGFTYLPAKGLTFTILANAHVVAENIINDTK